MQQLPLSSAEARYVIFYYVNVLQKVRQTAKKGNSKRTLKYPTVLSIIMCVGAYVIVRAYVHSCIHTHARTHTQHTHYSSLQSAVQAAHRRALDERRVARRHLRLVVLDGAIRRVRLHARRRLVRRRLHLPAQALRRAGLRHLHGCRHV